MSDFIERVAMQGVYNWTWHYKFGATKVLQSTATNEAIWQSGGDYTGFPAETETLSIVSASASDTAKTLTIQGLDANFDSIEEKILNQQLKPQESKQNKPQKGINRGNFATSWK